MVGKKDQRAFTLIELLIVIAIIGILAAVAIPMYRQQIVRSRLTEVTNSMSHMASAVSTYYQEMDNFPSGLDKASIHTTLGVGLENVVRISAASVTAGLISVTVANCGAEVDGFTLTLTPSVHSDGSISWIWGGNVTRAYMPAQ